MQITIPEPCRAGREHFSPSEKGKYCALCQKEVIDFSNMSVPEIQQFFKQEKGKVCGSFRKEQLAQLSAPPPQLPRWMMYAGALLALAPLPTLATGTAPAIEMREPQQALPPKKINVGDSVVVEGRVLDGENGEPLHGVNIIINGTTRYVVTDKEGRFTLTIPYNETQEQAFTFSFVGYIPEIITVDALYKQQYIEVKLSAAVVGMLEESIICKKGLPVAFGTLLKAGFANNYTSVEPWHAMAPVGMPCLHPHLAIPPHTASINSSNTNTR